MNRRLFLKRFGIGAAAIVAVPMVLSKDKTYPAFDHKMLQDRIDTLTAAQKYHLDNCKKMYTDWHERPQLRYSMHHWYEGQYQPYGGLEGFVDKYGTL